MSYYNGNLDADLNSLKTEPDAELLDCIGARIGYGRAQQILQILWAQHLRSVGVPTSGALLPNDLQCNKKSK